MFKFNKICMAVALAMASIGASAQQSNSTDMFGQEPSTTRDTVSTPAVVSGRRVSITNAGQGGATGVQESDDPKTLGPSRRMRGGERGSVPADLDDNNQLDGRHSSGMASDERRPELSEFQKFISDNTGQTLPIFGSDFFINKSSTFSPVLNSPVPSDYPLGPGDELTIRGWGTIDIDFRATVDRNGTISIPTVGSIPLAGVKAGEAESVIRNAVGRLYKGVTISVNFGQLRGITIYVVGQASRPGTYTVSSLSTLVTALFASGGPNANGSMRHVQVKRNGKTAAELDLYAFIGKGDKSADIKLQDGDTIYIPPAGSFVALTGKVNTPAVYELKNGNDTIESLLDIAGGLPVVADPRRAFLERIDPSTNHPRTVEQFALESSGLKRTLKNGDVLNVTSITPDFANAVSLRGNVDQPVRVPFKSGMRISDLIPSREYLISRKSTRRQNSVIAGDAIDKDSAKGNYKGRKRFGSRNDSTSDLEDRDTTVQAESIAGSIGGLIDQINWDYAVVERVDRKNLSVKLIPFNLGNMFANPNGQDNIQLMPGDTVTIFSQDDVAVPMEKRQIFVRVEGEVNVPGVYQMTAGDTLQTLIAKAGGPTSNAYLFGTGFYREEVRKEQRANLQRVADRLEGQIRNEQATQMANLRAMSPGDAAAAASQFEAERQASQERIARFRKLQPSGRIAFGLKPEETSFARLPQVSLQNGDRLLVPAKPAYVHILGAVNVEASPLWRPNSRVKDYIEMAGTSTDADIDNAFVLRVDGTVVSNESSGWLFGKIGGVIVMPGDSIIVPEKLDKTAGWAKFMQGAREWTQIFANFGLGAAAIKTLRD